MGLAKRAGVLVVTSARVEMSPELPNPIRDIFFLKETIVIQSYKVLWRSQIYVCDAVQDNFLTK